MPNNNEDQGAYLPSPELINAHVRRLRKRQLRKLRKSTYRPPIRFGIAEERIVEVATLPPSFIAED